jgi:hypothetical protein
MLAETGGIELRLQYEHLDWAEKVNAPIDMAGLVSNPDGGQGAAWLGMREAADDLQDLGVEFGSAPPRQ